MTILPSNTPEIYVGFKSLTLTSYAEITEISWTNSTTYNSYFQNEIVGSTYSSPTIGSNTIKYKNKPSSYGWNISLNQSSTKNTYDLTDVDMITIKVDDSNSSYGFYDHGEIGTFIGVSETNSTDGEHEIIYCSGPAVSSEVSTDLIIDVSYLVGNYYIFFGSYVFNGSDTSKTSNYLYTQYQGPLKLYGG